MTHYPHTPGYKAWGTSMEAAWRIETTARTVRGEVLRLLQGMTPQGLTSDQIARSLRQSILTVRPRVTELKTLNLVERTGERRTNASGMQAWVWRAIKPRRAAPP